MVEEKERKEGKTCFGLEERRSGREVGKKGVRDSLFAGDLGPSSARQISLLRTQIQE